jgi:hypothetical protein
MIHDVVLVFLVYHLLTSTVLVPFVAKEKGRSAVGWAIGALIFFTPIPVLIALAALPPGTADEPVSSFDAELRRR